MKEEISGKIVKLIKESESKVGQLYDVLADAYGNIIDGFHRLKANPNWKVRKLDWVKTEKDRLLVRLIANTARRNVKIKERKQHVTELAKILRDKERVPREKMVSKIAEMTPFTPRHVRRLLPEEFKVIEKRRITIKPTPMCFFCGKIMTKKELKERLEEAKKDVELWAILPRYYGDLVAELGIKIE